jgi:hypothetical protein
MRETLRQTTSGGPGLEREEMLRPTLALQRTAPAQPCTTAAKVRRSIVNAFFAMGTPPTINDSSSYLMWAAQNWTFLVLPTFTFMTFLIVLVVQWVQASSASADTPGAST